MKCSGAPSACGVQCSTERLTLTRSLCSVNVTCFAKKDHITRIIFFAYLSDDTSINGRDSFDILTSCTEKEVYRKMLLQ